MRFFKNSFEFALLYAAIKVSNKRIREMQLDLSKIIAAAAHSQSAVDSLIDQFKAVSAQLKDVSAQLAAAIAGQGDLGAVQAQLDQVADSIDAEAKKAEAAPVDTSAAAATTEPPAQ